MPDNFTGVDAALIKETGKVVALENDGLWVETVQRSACHVCAVQKGCGQGVLARFVGNSAVIRVLPGECDLKDIQANDQVVIGIPEDVLVRGTLLLYFLPLLMLVTGAVLAAMFSTSDVFVAMGALLGLLGGGLIARLHSLINKNNIRIQPQLLAHLPAIELV
ncbi:SoxR reducing system RseC family protein [Porticoccus litoralis]|uniref:SoxR reducing system RseC family protein n=1 Tax=Porticoccus litoralis TaxID=434086 RepID=A0AAW8B5T8_9GAMM|nr:SoxR reducing system RseC family protein [Porticoccus litoralis]MDP1521275.1 SoxR reducing system RseC family protein [Porticoccus litoralis]